MNELDVLPKTCVQIYQHDAYRGSGVLVRANDIFYVVSAAHVFKYEAKSIFDPKDFYGKSEKYGKFEFDKIIGNREDILEYDIVVISVYLENKFPDFPEIKFCEDITLPGISLIFRGTQHSPALKPHSINPCYVDTCTDEKGTFCLKVPIEAYADMQGNTGAEVLTGYSGSGVFIRNSDDIYLVGICQSVDKDKFTGVNCRSIGVLKGYFLPDLEITPFFGGNAQLKLNIAETKIVDGQPNSYPAEILKRWNSDQENNYSVRSIFKPNNQASTIAAIGLIDEEIEKTLNRIIMLRFFGSFNVANVVRDFAANLTTDKFTLGSPKLRSKSLAWCSRLLCSIDLAKATEYLEMAQALPACTEQILAEAFLLKYKTGIDAALSLLEKKSSLIDPQISISTKFIIRDSEESLNWLAQANINFSNLDIDGKIFYLSRSLLLQQWVLLQDKITELEIAELKSSLALQYYSAMGHLTFCVVPEKRLEVTRHIPLNPKEFRIAADPVSLEHLTRAIEYFRQCEEKLKEEGLTSDSELASDYALWLELKHPQHFAQAFNALKLSFEDKKLALRRLNLGLSYNLDLDLDAIQKQIDNELALTNNESFNAKYALYTLTLWQSTPSNALKFFHLYRTLIASIISMETAQDLEIDLLIHDGRNNEALDRLEYFVSEGADQDTINTLRQKIETTSTQNMNEQRIDHLKNDESLSAQLEIIEILNQRESWGEAAKFNEKLFRKTRALEDLIKLCRALKKAEDYDGLKSIITQNRNFLALSPELSSDYCWVLYIEGELTDCSKNIDLFKKQWPSQKDHDLHVLLKILSGNWESLNSFVEEEVKHRAERSPEELLRTAALAQKIGSNHVQKLVFEATSKAPVEHIFLNAYQLAVAGGWEHNEIAASWFQKAVSSPEEGSSLLKFNLREIFDLEVSWRKDAENTRTRLNEGELPLFMASNLLNCSLFDLFLFPAISNSKQSDVRRKVSINAFSAAININMDYQSIPKSIGLDFTALITFAHLNLLRELANGFDRFIIPHRTLPWLFEEKQKIKHHQPSRIRDAKKLKHLLDLGIISTHIMDTVPDLNLADQIGEELATLLTKVKQNSDFDKANHLVVHPYPVYKLGSFLEETIDLSIFKGHVCSCMAIVDMLKSKGQLTQTEEERARLFISHQEQRWPDEPEIPNECTLYVDGSVVSHLQAFCLLEKLHAAGIRVVITASKKAEIMELLNAEVFSDEAYELIEKIRSFLVEHLESGKIKLAPSPVKFDTQQSTIKNHPTMGIKEMISMVDHLVIDDRYFNKNTQLAVDNSKLQLLSSVSVLHFLEKTRTISSAALYEAKAKLRRAGFLHIPIEVDELNYFLSMAIDPKGEFIETGELRLMRENILQCQMGNSLKIPQESMWLDELINAVSNTIKQQWASENSDLFKNQISSWLFNLIDLRNWDYMIKRDIQDGSINGVYVMCLLKLLTISNFDSRESKHKYFDWIAAQVLRPFKMTHPEIYTQLVNNVRTGFTTEIAYTGSKLIPAEAKILVEELFPAIITDDLIDGLDDIFKNRLGIENQFTNREQGLKISCKELFLSAREALANPGKPTAFHDAYGEEWTAEASDRGLGMVKLTRHDNINNFQNLWPLLPKAQRIKALENILRQNYISENEIVSWQDLLRATDLSENETITLLLDTDATPSSFARNFFHNTERDPSIESWVPQKSCYYERLIGKYNNEADLSTYVDKVLKAHLQSLIQWDPAEGLRFSFLLASHSSISLVIDLDLIPAEIVENIYEDISINGDPISQLGAIECGIPKIKAFPNIEPHIVTMLETIREDDPDLLGSKFKMLSNLFILVDSEISRQRTLDHCPPFCRRLASITHASLIGKTLLASGCDISEFNEKMESFSSADFHTQSLCDLRLEPRWLPSFISSKHLKADFIGRLTNNIDRFAEHISTNQRIFQLLIGEGPENITNSTDPAYRYWPGPLEGGNFLAVAPPPEIETLISNRLAEKNISTSSFLPLINACLFFEVSPEFSLLAAKALEEAKYRLGQDENNEPLQSLLSGLAIVAASTRSSELAESLRILIRIGMEAKTNRLNIGFGADIAIIAAASRADLTEWSRFIGDCFTEISYCDLSKDEAKILLDRIFLMRRCAPSLWSFLAKATAALRAIAG